MTIEKSPLRRHKFLFLLLTILALAIVQPLAGGPALVFNLIYCAVLLAAVHAVARHRRLFWVAAVLSVPVLLATWSAPLESATPGAVGRWLVVAWHGAGLTFLGMVAGFILYEVLEDEKISTDKIWGAICVYLLLGTAWALLYAMLERLRPGSFSMNVSAGATTADQFAPFTYYSFVTLTTLGYGDVTPIAPAARTFSWLEAATGQLYIAVLVARLVGLHISRGGAEPE